MKKIRYQCVLVTPLPWDILSNCFQDKFFAQASVQKIPAKISLGYPSVKVVIK